ncbi:MULTISPECIES: hypothetical protein [Muribaculum]|jgi:hypothetical protein|uniref:DUF3868 domain-containing protein n=2 Tax=Muribaculum TaxID=1918540 RepID=A0A4P7VQ75_9BACT|nr:MULTISPECIES: hypothetical protein [Muribaculum]MCX4278297.1 hypothetical protein [Muribaculum sp.]QCD36424.1 hypothetical protein E7746_11285 [Muribaculum gordoncarteri]ROT14756.1 hypothetical protein EEL48_04490 [Muribaculaceae bacterium Isolate-102 (HZI)]
MLRVIVTSLLVLAVTSVAAPDTRTTRKKLVKSEQEVTVVADSTTVSPDSITIADYDKPLRSNYETFFVTNRHSRTIVRITIDIDYIDMNGSQLHSRSVTVECEIPPGATRQLHTRAWDRQKAFYHHTTRSKPRSPHARPYKVVVTPVSLLLE